MMGDIYKKPSLVRAWLGLPNEKSRVSLRLLDKLKRLHLTAGKYSPLSSAIARLVGGLVSCAG